MGYLTVPSAQIPIAGIHREHDTSLAQVTAGLETGSQTGLKYGLRPTQLRKHTIRSNSGDHC